jgi:hypothetical protein
MLFFILTIFNLGSIGSEPIVLIEQKTTSDGLFNGITTAGVSILQRL